MWRGEVVRGEGNKRSVEGRGCERGRKQEECGGERV